MEKQRNLIILGTYNSRGNTYKASKILNENLAQSSEIIDINRLRITDYSYEGSNDDDDFMYLIQKMLVSRNIILATPVYWFTMSTPMKKFWDRFTDLVTLVDKKPLGRKMAKKNVYLLITGAEEKLCDSFEVPFKLTCKYLALNYIDCEYIYIPEYGNIEESELVKIDNFSRLILENDRPI